MCIRDRFYTDASFTYLEDRIAELITDNFIQCSDTFYAMPYLNVRTVTHTASQMRPDLENNIYAVKSYAAKARRVHNIFLEWDISRTNLSVDVVRRVKTVKNVDFSNPDYILTCLLYTSIVGWKTQGDKTWMTSAYIKEVERHGKN